MKFSNGHWLKREGVTVHNIAEVRSYDISEDAVTLYCPPFKVAHRGMTLDGPLLNLKFTSPAKEILALEITHFEGGLNNAPRFEINDAKLKLDVREEENALIIASGKTEARVSLDEFAIAYSYDGRYLTSTGMRRTGYAQTPEGNFMLEQLDLGVAEKIYGLGERFTPFVKNGQVVDIWNEDGGTASEQSYKNVPFYLSSNNYGVFVNHTERVSFELASEVVSRVQFSVPGEKLRYVIIGGNTRKEILNKYTGLTGRPALPPAWSFGLWLTTSFTTDYDERTVTSFIDGMAERNCPLHVFHYDCFWMREYEWCNFTWDDAMFPDVDAMLRRLKSRGLKICVWINPYIGQKSPLFKEAMENGYLIKKADGSVWQWDKWQAAMGVVDFTNPQAKAWYLSKLKALLDQGVDCFKTDFGERIPFENVKYYDNSDTRGMHNYYSYLYNKAVFDLLVKERGEGDAVVFARSATAGGQKFPVHWGGDCDSTYPSMAESLRGGLSLTLSGFGFWSHDIGGFENTATPDLYKRWAAFGLLSTHSRLHGSSSYRVPWLFGDEAVDVVRKFTNLKCRLMPYIYSAACETSKTGVPSMRAMLLEFEEDRTCLDIDTQYMLGRSILVAPVFREDSVAEFYLPRGTWTHLLSGEIREGASWYKEKYDYLSLPLFARENSIVPFGANDVLADYDYVDGLEMRLYALKDGKEASYTVYGRNGAECISMKAKRAGNRITIEFSGGTPDVRLCGIDSVKDVSGASTMETDLGILLRNTEPKIEVRLQ